jgi:predicted aspartyl protease
MLQNLGVVPHDRAEFELADGNVAEMDIGRTWVRIDGRSEIVPIIFGEEGTTALLGAVTLGIFRLGVDLVRQELIPVRGLVMASGEHRYRLMQPSV